ncbi:aminotransferase class IV [Psychrobacter sp. I-STPA10]|uniref:aminotransferase class IV n=1 Tax=Psychrobacter sp. I-STPA10 TaxID=2585769 RepID=UPI001E4C40C8|nr:aminotransferase class IV [Psychrobacter sp. I-STPA10]
MPANLSPFLSNPMASQGMQWYVVSSDRKDVPQPIAGLSPSHRAIAYGDGFFTTTGVRVGQIQWQSYHQQRIKHHAAALQINLDAVQLANLWQQVEKYAQQIDHGMIKIIVTRQNQAIRGYGFVTDTQANQADIWLGVLQTPPITISESESSTASNPFLYSLFLPSLLSVSIPIAAPITALSLSTQIGCTPAHLAGLKTLNRLDNVMAAAELQQRKAQLIATDLTATQPRFAITEGLVKDVSGQWVEGTMSNVFYQLNDGVDDKNEQWYTPPIDRSGVNGVMRQVIIDKLKVTTTAVIERRLHDLDLPKLSSMFFCNAVRGVMPVGELVLPNQTVMDLY